MEVPQMSVGFKLHLWFPVARWTSGSARLKVAHQPRCHQLTNRNITNENNEMVHMWGCPQRASLPSVNHHRWVNEFAATTAWRGPLCSRNPPLNEIMFAFCIESTLERTISWKDIHFQESLTHLRNAWIGCLLDARGTSGEQRFENPLLSALPVPAFFPTRTIRTIIYIYKYIFE